MSKKPASLTSDLLARKGEAEPLSIDPGARMSLFAGPDFSPGGGAGRPDDERPEPPEPEIIYTAEETTSGGGHTRLIVGAVLGAIAIGGVLLTLSSRTDRGVAPVSPEIAAEAPQAAAPAPQTPAATPEAAPVAPAPTALPEQPPAAEQPTAPEAVAPATPDLRTGETAAPAETAPAPVRQEEAPAKPQTAAQTPASGGAYVVQILALREEKSAQAGWAQLVKRFPSVLSGHALDIEKADLGDKGTYYRVRAAGFATKAAAQSACARLKAGGQDCMVKKR